jgi:hypothetical protein
MALEPEHSPRATAIAYLERRRKFFADALGYVAVNGALWLIWALTGHSNGGRLPWPAWVSLIWGFFLALDALKVFGPLARKLEGPIGEEEIQREIDRAAHHS